MLPQFTPTMVSTSQTLNPIAIVMVPLPIQGHLNPLLHLALHLSSRRLLPVHYVSSSTHVRQALSRLHGWPHPFPPLLHFHPLPFPPFPSPSPSLSPTSKFPSHLQPSFDAASSLLLPHLSSLIRSLSLSHARVILLHDSSISSAASAASPQTDRFSFHTASAISNLVFLGDPSLSRANLHSCFTREFFDWVVRQRMLPAAEIKGRVLNTCRGIESGFLERLLGEETWEGQRVFAVGPLNPIGGDGGRRDEECLRWLDGQGEASVVYVSFGTTASVSREQAREIAAGLEASGCGFVWVRRNADRCDVFEAVGEEEEEDLVLVEWEQR